MKKRLLIPAIITLFLLGALSARATTLQYYCKSKYRKLYSTKEECVREEDSAREWLTSRPVDREALSACRARQGPAGNRSYLITKRCVERASERAYQRTISPYNIKNSDVWFAPILRDSFPSLVRACGLDRPLDGFAVLPNDITKFHLTPRLLYKDMIPLLRVDGYVNIGHIPAPFKAGKVKGMKGGGYPIYIDAFLFSEKGLMVDARSIRAPRPVAASGGTVRFKLFLGKGYFFSQGGTLLVVASGNPIHSSYPGEPCTLIGAKRIRLKGR